MAESLPLPFMFIYILSIALSIVGGLLVGYFAGRARNGQADDMILIEARLNELASTVSRLDAELLAVKAKTTETTAP